MNPMVLLRDLTVEEMGDGRSTERQVRTSVTPKCLKLYEGVELRGKFRSAGSWYMAEVLEINVHFGNKVRDPGCVGLNSLQSGLHKQHMKDLFVELCLTVPVSTTSTRHHNRLSSLLPYLPMLMDPLVSALNGSQTLVSQGLRTLELCVDNLQPDFLFSHIEPVKAELMQALWRCLNNAPDSTAAVAYRVLGKFGGSNRKMLHAPQKLTIKDYNTVGPCVAITFLEGRSPINLPVDTAIETALNLLKTSLSSGASPSSSSSSSSLPPSTELYYQQHAWNFVRTYLISTLVSSGGKVGHDGGSGAGGGGGGDATSDSSFVSFAGGSGSASTFEDIYHYFSRYDLTAYTPQPNSTSLYICPDVHARRTHIKALCAMFVASSVKDLTDVNDFIISMVTHYALVAISQQIGPSSLNQDDLDSMMTLDPQTMIDAIINIIGGEERDLANISLLALATILKACKLPLFEYLSEKIVYLCYERAWYNKIGGCQLTEQQKVEFFTVSCSDCVKELCRHITSPNQLVREHSLAAATNQSLNCLMEPFKEVIMDVVPPKKHLLRYQPPQAQIGIMEGNAFCMCMEPHLVTLDMNVVEHQLFFKELCHLCDDDDAALLRMNCYKNVSDFVPLRISAIKVLSACHHVSEKQNNIFSILYKALNSTNVQLQDVALVCMKRFVSGCQVEISMVHTTMRPLLQHLSDFSNLNLHRIKTHLKKWFEFSSTPQKLCQIKATGQVLPVEQKICAAIIEMFHLIPAASQKMIDLLVMLVVKGEKDLFVASNSPFRPPTLKFLLRHPEATVDFFFSEGKLQDTSFNALFRWLLEQDKGQSFRDNLMTNPQRLLNLTVPPYKGSVDYPLWQEPSILLEILLSFFKHHPNELELLFHMLKCFTGRYMPQFTFFKEFLEETVSKTYSIEWKRNAFFKFVEIFHLKDWSQEVKSKILQHILIPCFAESFDRDEGEQLIGGPPTPDQESDDNVISIFINKVIDPDNPFGTSDAVRILLLQLSCLFVDKASKYIHDVANNLLKAHAVEARAIVRQALDVLTPVMPGRMEDENATAEHRKLAVDLAEVILNWEVQRLAEEGDESLKTASGGPEVSKPIDKAHCDTAVNFLLRIACQMTETPGSPSDQLSRRCILLLKKALSPQVWSNIDLKLNWFDKILMSVEGQQPNINHICTSLELLTFLTGILKKETILSSFKSLQRGVAACMTSTNIRIIRVVHTLLSNLMSIFPTEPAASTVASKFEELECLYACVSKLIYEGLANYEKLITSFMRVLQRLVREHLSSTTQSSPTSGTAPASSAAGSSTSAAASSSAAAAAAAAAASAAASPESTVSLCELLIISLDLVKNRTGVMNPEMRKGFLGNILVGLIEKSPDVKVIKAILKILDEWMKNKSPASVNQIPCLREKAFLLMKLMNFVEKRFPDDLEINAQFLELVHYLYSDETLKTTDLASKLEPAFLAGLRCVQPHIRKMFMTTFEASMRRRLFDRLHYIVTTQNWEAMGGHFWIKQCLELLFLVTNLNIDVNVSSANSFLAPISTSSLSSSSSSLMAATFPAATFSTAAPVAAASASAVPMEVESGDQSMEAGASREDSEQQQQQTSTSSPTSCPSAFSGDPSQQDCVMMQVSAMERMTLDVRKAAINMLTSRSVKFIQECQQVTDKTQVFIESLIQMCHNSTTLAYDTWIQFFPRVWATLNDKFQNFLKNELTPFIASGNHLVQRDSHPSAIKAFVEAMSYCGSPSLYIRPSILKYLAKSHNIWHRCLLCLEGQVYQGGLLGSQLFSKLNTQGLLPNATAAQSSATSKQMDALEAMVDLYGRLKEEDMVAGVWMKRCKYQATYTAIALEQHGLFFHAQEEYEKVMSQGQTDSIHTAIPNSLVAEFKLWENQWFRCSKEMNHWDLILEYSKNPDHLNPALMLESSWRQSQWQATKSALVLVEDGCPREDLWRINLYKGYLAVCHPEDQNLSSVGGGLLGLWDGRVMWWEGGSECTMLTTMVEKLVETSSGLAIKEWRRLPHIVSQIHVEYLQAAQLIIELQEAASLAASMQPSSMGREQSNHDIKAIIKTWRNRMPSITDDLSHWGHIFQWRQEHFQAITNIYEQLGTNDVSQQNASMLGVHHTAVGMVEFGKIARKHSLPSVCLDSLSKIHSIASVPVVDCYQKIRQQVKCYLLMSGNMGKSELQEGLEVIESTTLKYFTKEMISEFYALKGLFLVQMAKSEEANKAFSAAVQLHDAQVKAWFLWGEYLEALFIRERTMQLAISTIVCYLQACRNQNEIKSRKYIAKILWLLSYDDESNQLTEQLEKHSGGIPTAFWLVWIPQLLSCLIRSETRYVINLISKVGSVYPQAVYFPTRTLYLTLKVEQREIYNRSSSSATGTTTSTTTATTSTTTSSTAAAATSSTSSATAPLSVTPVTAMSSTSLLSPPPADMSHGNLAGLLNSPEHVGPMKATNSMWKCSRVMHMQRDTQPTVLSLLESIIDQMVWFRENCYEEVLRQLKQALSKCYTVAFESRGTVTDAQVTTNTLNFIKKIVSTFGVGVETSAAATAAATTATLSPGTSTSVGAPWSQQQQAMSSSLMSMFGNAGSESLARRCLTAAQDPIFQRMKAQFIVDFDFSAHGSTRLQNVMNKLKKWIRIMETRISSLPKTFLIEEKCRVLSYFNMSMLEIELPGEFLVPQQNGYYMKIERFLPQVDIVHKLNSATRRLYIRGQNGKIYPYLVVNNTCMNESRREERVYQLFRMMNVFLSKQKSLDTATQHSPSSLSLPPSPSSSPPSLQSLSSSSSLGDGQTFDPLLGAEGCGLESSPENCTKQSVDPDQPITRYYERLAAIQLRGSQPSHQVLCDLLRDVQANMVPRSVLKEWAIRNYAHATDYWTFRKNVTTHLGLLGLSEFVLHLTRLDPDMIHLHRDSGFVHAAYFKFDIDDETGDLNANRPVPFRLTPNLTEFMTQLNIIGPLLATMIATARCLVQPQYKLQSFLCAILRDEYMAWYKKKQEELNPGVQPPEIPGELLVQVVSKAVQAITIRLQNLAAFEGADSKVTTLVVAANSLDNLCRMDPAWHPWL
ncbi:hypothetical protein HELRODRAFT_194551 [Helobdella robusta]|uniref:Non-specific serine/threonine protein kinase n=1 Tax=Helobdella robusta TaxID=6412 RepID=T1FW68_HELRO|nr:hypothetical protein HELRODRAFT_194551 [Helobdella robusta]ESN91105.1 hypothetical protein HELRODRAFT_194551 [Helobdella robusta]